MTLYLSGLRCHLNRSMQTPSKYIDSTMLPREKYLFGCARPKPCQGSVLAALAPASDFSFCFQYKGSSSLVLRRPIEITSLIRT